MSQIFDLTAEAPVLKQRYENAKVRNGFLEDFPQAIAAADLVISRSGGSVSLGSAAVTTSLPPDMNFLISLRCCCGTEKFT